MDLKQVFIGVILVAIVVVLWCFFAIGSGNGTPEN